MSSSTINWTQGHIQRRVLGSFVKKSHTPPFGVHIKKFQTLLLRYTPAIVFSNGKGILEKPDPGYTPE